MNPVPRSPDRPTRILAIDPSSRGFGYAVFERTLGLIDWGTRETGRDTAACLTHVTGLILSLCPGVVVVEDHRGKSTRRCGRVRALIQQIVESATDHGVETFTVSRRAVRAVFVPKGATTKHQIALEIARLLPELAPRVPPFRKPWMSEDARMSIFDAASFALTYLALNPLETKVAADFA